MSKKVLVTGGNGFIGSHVVDNLKEKGHKVTIYDRFNKHTHREDVNFYLGDVKEKDSVFEAVSKHDAVINLAGILGTAESIDYPIPLVEVNVVGALNVFDACRKFDKQGMQIGVGNYFMNNSYSITKNSAVRFALMYNEEHNAEIAIVRGFNAYGERQKHRPVRKVVPNMVIPALLDEPLTVYGDGTQIMDMIYVKDLAEIIVRATLRDHGIYDEIFEGGLGEDVTINDLAETIVDISDSDSEIKHVSMRAGEEEQSVVKGDPSTLEPLDYSKEDMTSLEKGLKKTIAWYEEHLDEFEWDE